MTALVRSCLWISHLAVAGVGVMVGTQAWPSDEKHAPVEKAESSGKPGNSRSVGTHTPDLDSSSRYSGAWESLKDKRLSRQERLAIQNSLLCEWSVVDFAAAVRAVFAEGPGGDQDDLLKSCAPGLLADPSAAWELVTAGAFGWESARVRTLWLRLITDADPLRVFSVLNQLPSVERKGVVSQLASTWGADSTDPDVREAIWSQFLAMGNQPWGDKALCAIGQTIGSEHRPAELDDLMATASTPAEKKLLGAAYATALYDREDEEFEIEFASIPSALRADVAAAGMQVHYSGSERIFEFAKLALAEGNLDAFPAAADYDAIAKSAKDSDDPGALADWALTLPEDPRIMELYRTSIGGAAVRDFPMVREKILALPPGWQRDQGIAALAYGGHYSDQSIGEIERLLEHIQDPEVQARAKEDYRERREADER